MSQVILVLRKKESGWTYSVLDEVHGVKRQSNQASLYDAFIQMEDLPCGGLYDWIYVLSKEALSPKERRFINLYVKRQHRVVYGRQKRLRLEDLRERHFNTNNERNMTSKNPATPPAAPAVTTGAFLATAPVAALRDTKLEWPGGEPGVLVNEINEIEAAIEAARKGDDPDTAIFYRGQHSLLRALLNKLLTGKADDLYAKKNFDGLDALIEQYGVLPSAWAKKV